MNYADKSFQDLIEMRYISEADFLPEADHMLSFKHLALGTSWLDLKMRPVLYNMIDHFADGSGTEYTNPVLTQKVEEHPNTQAYMADFTALFKEKILEFNGDIESFTNTNEIYYHLKDNNFVLTDYAYGGNPFDTDTYSGLTTAVHSWTDVTVILTEYEQIGNRYFGALQFIFSDNFGLDSEDIEGDGYGAYPFFRSWYILQHYVEYNGKYKPFQVKVTIDYEFSGFIK